VEPCGLETPCISYSMLQPRSWKYKGSESILIILNLKVHNYVHKITPLNPVLDQVNPDLALHCLVFNISLLLGISTLRFTEQNYVSIHHFPIGVVSLIVVLTILSLLNRRYIPRNCKAFHHFVFSSPSWLIFIRQENVTLEYLLAATDECFMVVL
jgi:hypothetical protein